MFHPSNIASITLDEFPVAASLTDNFANPTTTVVGSMLMVWDGATWDRVPGNSTDGTLVNLGTNNDVTVTGSVTANAGTNLNTSLLALEAGGNLAGAATSLAIMDDWDNAASDGASVSGDVAHDSADAGEPVKIGFKAYDPASMPSDVTANDRVNGVADLKGRQMVYLGTTLDSTNDSISTIFSTHSNTNTSANAASLVIKASAGRLIEIRGYNAKASAQFIQVHDAASLPADTAVPEETFTVAASSNFTISFSEDKSFTTGIVVCNSSTEATKTIGSADCWFSADYR